MTPLSLFLPPAGQRVLVYDETGSQSGPGCAEYLAAAGVEVQLVTPDRMIAQDVGVTNHTIHLRNLHNHNVEILTDKRLLQVEQRGNQLAARFQHEYSAKQSEALYDQIVVEAGTVPDETLYAALQSASCNNGLAEQQALLNAEQQPQAVSTATYSLYRIGDCVSARGIHAAMLDAQRLCRGI